jgi:hypothetical protein
MESSFFVLLLLIVLIYLWNMYTQYRVNKEPMSMLRYRPLMTGDPAPLDYDDNIAGIPDPNSYQVLPNVNQYANNLAFNPNNPNSANLMVNGRSVMDPNAYQYFGNKDSDVVGRNSN